MWKGRQRVVCSGVGLAEAWLVFWFLVRPLPVLFLWFLLLRDKRLNMEMSAKPVISMQMMRMNILE